MPLRSCRSRINHLQVDDAQYKAVVMPMYNLLEYSDNYLKISRILWQYCRNEPAVNDNGEIIDFTADNSETDSSKIKKTSKKAKNGQKQVKIMLPLKKLSNFWRILEMLLINCKINLDVKWSENCVTVANNADTTQQNTFNN